ncbi:hypothetical protein ACEPAF_9311 [Sanghuangporus sanghuang]
MARDSYVPHRRLLYALLWMIAVVELGLTAFRIHHTRSLFGFYDRVIAELLVVSILTILWAPLTLLLHRSALGSAGATGTQRRGFGFLHGETSGNLILWIMWLVGAAIATNHWPTRALAGPGKQGRILTTIIALAWVEFALLTLAKMFAAMEYAALNSAGGAGSGYARDKPLHRGAAGTV